MNIVNNDNFDLLKLRYILFSKSTEPVEYRVAEFNTTNKKFKIIRTGHIDFDANVTVDKEITSCDFILGKEIDNHNGYTSFSYLRLGDNDDVFLDISFAYEEKYKTNTGKITKRTIFTALDKCLFTDWNKDEPIPEKMYIIAVYPNNNIPTLFRCYDNLKFNILNLDDTHVLANSYYYSYNIYTTKTVENHSSVSDVPILKFEDDKIKEEITPLAVESIDDDFNYHCDTLDLTVEDYGNVTIKDHSLTRLFIELDGGNVFTEKVDKSEVPGLENLREIIEESYECKLSDWDVTKLSDKNSDEELYYVKFKDNDKWTVTSGTAFINENYAFVNLYNKGSEDAYSNLMTVDLENSTIITDYYQYKDKNGHGAEYTDIRFLKFTYMDMKPTFPELDKSGWISSPLLMLMILKNSIRKEGVENYISYKIGDDIYHFCKKHGVHPSDYNRNVTTDLLTRKNKDGDEYYLIRGPLGELMPWYY